VERGEYFLDEENNGFWTWETEGVGAEEILGDGEKEGIGRFHGVNLGEDTWDNRLMLKIQEGVDAVN